MTELATAYGNFANLGHTVPLTSIIKTSSQVDSPLQSQINSHQSLTPELDPRVAFIINHILADPQARLPSFGRNSRLNIPNQQIPVKTGTTNNLRDNWTIGYTPDYLVAVWVGNFDNTPMDRLASGITGAAPIWNQIMTHLINQNTNQTPQNTFPWTPPAGLVETQICQWTGHLPCQGCPTTTEWFIQGTQPTRHCQPEYFQPTPAPN